jgi:hypothetical protein
MMIIKRIILFTCFSFLGSMSACAVQTCDSDYDSGKTVVYIINADENATSEQYADWSHYLNEFSASQGKDYVFKKVTSQKLEGIFENAAAYKKPYSMIFIKKGRPNLFHEGAIVEPQVYQYVYLFLQGKPVDPPYLAQFSPDEIKLQFKTCNHK